MFLNFIFIGFDIQFVGRNFLVNTDYLLPSFCCQERKSSIYRFWHNIFQGFNRRYKLCISGLFYTELFNFCIELIIFAVKLINFAIAFVIKGSKIGIENSVSFDVSVTIGSVGTDCKFSSFTPTLLDFFY